MTYLIQMLREFPVAQQSIWLDKILDRIQRQTLNTALISIDVITQAVKVSNLRISYNHSQTIYWSGPNILFRNVVEAAVNQMRMHWPSLKLSMSRDCTMTQIERNFFRIHLPSLSLLLVPRSQRFLDFGMAELVLYCFYGSLGLVGWWVTPSSFSLVLVPDTRFYFNERCIITCLPPVYLWRTF